MKKYYEKSGGYFFFFAFFFSMASLVADIEKDSTLTIGFTGDVMLGRLVNETIKENGYQFVWGNVLPYLHRNDINIINLETAITKHNVVIPKVFNFKTDPANVQALVAANIRVASLANNHILDFGPEGLRETLQTLRKAGINYVGAGKNAQEAHKGLILQKERLKIGVIAFTDNEPTWIAGKKKGGTNYIKVGDIATAKKQIDAIRSHVDLLIATIHWGPNMRERPADEFVAFAHALVDAGVDVIHGHSAHIFQGIEVYHNKLIMYDTGDFVDDYMVTSAVRNDLSFLFCLDVEGGKLKQLKLMPVRIENMQVNVAKEEDARWAIKRVKRLSEELGTSVSDEGTIEF